MKVTDLVVQTGVGHRQGGVLAETAGEVTLGGAERAPVPGRHADDLAQQPAAVPERHEQHAAARRREERCRHVFGLQIVGARPHEGLAPRAAAGGDPKVARSPPLGSRERRLVVARSVAAGAQPQRLLVGVVLVEQAGARGQAQPGLAHDLAQHLVVVERPRRWRDRRAAGR